MNKQAVDYPILEKIKAGWAAIGDGWAVHAPTKEAALQLYRERAEYYEWLDRQPATNNAGEEGEGEEVEN